MPAKNQTNADTTNKQTLFNQIKAGDNKWLYAACGEIVNASRKATRDIKALNKLLETRDNTINGLQAQQEEKEDGCNLTPLTPKSTDEEIRSHARMLLMTKLNDKSITATEFGQFKDVFGLANADSDITVTTIDYRSMCTDCPLGRAPEVPVLVD